MTPTPKQASAKETVSRMANSVAPVATPYPPFPRIPDAIKKKFPDLAPSWEQYEKSVDDFFKALQLIG